MSKRATTKRPAKSAKTSAAKTTTKQTTKEPAKAEKKSEKKVQKAVDYIGQINMVYVVSAVVFVLGAIAAWFLMSQYTQTITVGYWAKDELASAAQKKDVLVPAIRSIYDLQLRYAVIGILLLSAIVPIISVTSAKKRFVSGLKANRNDWAWIDRGITLALIGELIVLLNGATDLSLLKMSAGTILVTCLLGWIAEKQFAKDNSKVPQVYLVSILTGLALWLVAAHYAVATVWYGAVWAPWYVYAASGLALVSFCVMAFSTLQHYRGRKRFGNFLALERNSAVTNFVLKAGVATILIVGLLK